MIDFDSNKSTPPPAARAAPPPGAGCGTKRLEICEARCHYCITAKCLLGRRVPLVILPSQFALVSWSHSGYTLDWLHWRISGAELGCLGCNESFIKVPGLSIPSEIDFDYL